MNTNTYASLWFSCSAFFIFCSMSMVVFFHADFVPAFVFLFFAFASSIAHRILVERSTTNITIRYEEMKVIKKLRPSYFCCQPIAIPLLLANYRCVKAIINDVEYTIFLRNVYSDNPYKYLRFTRVDNVLIEQIEI